MTLSTPYSRVQIYLHWLSAAVILWTLISGSSVLVLDLPASLKKDLTAFNVSLTAAFIPFFILRCCLAIRRAARAAPCSKTLQQWLALIAHGALYAVTAVVLGSGVLMMGQGFSVFGLVHIDPLLTSPAYLTRFARLHIGSCVVLAALIALHIAAVIKHQWAGTPVIGRMWR